MRGPDGTRDHLAVALAELLPTKTALLRAAFGYTPGELPDVDTITSGEKPENHLSSAGDTWVEVVTPQMSRLTVVDITPAGDQQYRITYLVRIYIWALGSGWNDALDRRDRVTGAVRSLLLEFPTLTLAGGDTGMLVETTSMTEEYGVPVRPANPSGRCWATGMIGFSMHSEETLAQGRMRIPIGTNDRTLVATEAFGMAPLPADAPTPTPAPTP